MRARIAAFLLVLLVASGTRAYAQKALAIERFDAGITVHAGGTITVEERIRVRFTGAWNGIYRTIPTEYRTPQGLNFTLRLSVTSVTDGAGTALRYESSRERHYRKLKIWVPGAVNATRTIVVHYEVENGLRFFDEHDELYWNVTGDEWEARIEGAAATVRLPAAVEGVRATAFTGVYGSTARDASVDVAGSEVRVATTAPLGFREGLTVVIGWNPGAVARPTAVDRTVDTLRSNLPLAIPPFAFAGMLWLWRAKGRDPARRPIAVRYEPPGHLSPAEMGTLVDHKVDMRDVTSTLVDLAVRGYVLIEEKAEEVFFGLFSSRDYIFTLRKPRSEWESLKPHERRFLAALFPGGVAEDWVRLSDLKNKFYKNLPEITNRVFEQLVAHKYYVSRPDRVKKLYLGLGVGLAIAIVALGIWLSQRAYISTVAVVAAGVLTGLIVCAFALIMPARTREGTRALEEALGFEDFLRRVEKDRFERVVKTPELFEKYLPFAMALSVEESWARAFADICRDPPEWYRGSSPSHGFRTNSFVGNLDRMSAAAATTMASAPRSSGGSGFSGGSSGGGFGGGGGGGF
jgi:uncharacterized membrane protein